MDPEDHSDEVSDRNENRLLKSGEKAILQSPRMAEPHSSVLGKANFRSNETGS